MSDEMKNMTPGEDGQQSDGNLSHEDTNINAVQEPIGEPERAQDTGPAAGETAPAKEPKEAKLSQWKAKRKKEKTPKPEASEPADASDKTAEPSDKAGKPGDKAAKTSEKPEGKLMDKVKSIPRGALLGGIAAIVLVVAIVAGAAMGGSGKGMTKELKAAADEREQLVVGIMDTGYPPFIYGAYEGGYTGSDYDLMKAVCDHYGWELVIKEIDWNNRNAMLEDGTVDCLWSGFNSFGREDVYAWTEPYLDTSDVIVVKSNNKDIKVLDDLENKVVAAAKDTTAYLSLESIGLALSRMGCEDILQVGQMLGAGEADAAVMTRQEAEAMDGVKVLDECLNYNTFAVACKADNTVLRDLIDLGLDAARK